MPVHINFFKEAIKLRLLHKQHLTQWLIKCLKDFGYTNGEVNIILCSDSYLLKMNQAYLNHHYYTDIITFDNGSTKPLVMADLFISVNSVQKNAKTLQIKFDDELHRVMVHGLLHLCGYGDKTKAQIMLMRKAEDHYLSLRKF
jgi:probable rRNA maturation factor